MTFSDAARHYEGFTRRLAARAAAGIDAMFASPRRVFIERCDFVLGAEAIPAPVAVRNIVPRR